MVSAVLKCLTDPNDVKAFVQIWTDDGVSDAEALVRVVPANKLGDGVVVDAWTVREHVFKQPVERQSGGGSPGGVKLAGTAYRRDDFTLEAFFEYWRNVHAPISGSVPGLGGYVVSEVRSLLSGRRAEARRPPRAVVAGDEATFEASATHRSRRQLGRTFPATRRRPGCSGCCASRCSFPRLRPVRARSTPQMPELRPDILRTPHSGIRRMLELAQTVASPIMLVNGDPNFRTPDHIVESAAEAAFQGATGYAPGAGVQELRDAVADKVTTRERPQGVV